MNCHDVLTPTILNNSQPGSLSNTLFKRRKTIFKMPEQSQHGENLNNT